MSRIASSKPAARRALLVIALIVLIGAVGMDRGSGGGGSASERTAHGAVAARQAPRSAAPPVLTATTSDSGDDEAAADALRLEGQVMDDEDQPVGGAEVTLGARVAVSEADGSFAFDDVPAGSYDVSAALGDAFAEVQQVELDANSEPVALRLKRGPTLVVHVVDERGRPFAGASVEVGRRSFTTPVSGTVRIRGVDTDDESVDVRAAGRARVHRLVQTTADPAATVECTFTLRAGSAMAGIVLDGAGRPVADAAVELEPAGDPSRSSMGFAGDIAFSDEHGAWQLDSLGSGDYLVHASSMRHAAGPQVRVVHDGSRPSAGVVLRVEPGAQIAGLVVDETGRPIAEAQVMAAHHLETTDARGAFVIEGLEPGSYDVSASTTTHGAPAQQVMLDRRGRAQVTLTLERSSLAGVVVDHDGQPFGDAVVFASSDVDHRFHIGHCDDAGRFDLGGVPAGHYKVAAQRRSSRVEGPSVEVNTTNRQLVLVVPSPARVTGRVLLDGAPLAHFGVAITDNPDHEDAAEVYGATGRFTERDAQPGTHAVVITGEGLVRRVLPSVAVVAGQTTDLGDIIVERAR